MSDTINRQDAIDRINKQREHLQPDVYPQDAIGDAAYRICAEFIERLPSAEHTGKWLEDSEWWYQTIYRCSECGKQVSNMSNYCPDCGADMRGEE